MTAQRLTQDKVLVHRALTREKGGATRLVARYRGMVVSHFQRSVKEADRAQDLAQETFFQAFRDLGKLRDIEQFRAWLMTIARRALSRYRRAGDPEEPSSGEFELEEVAADGGEDQLERRLAGQELWSHVTDLPDPFRTTLLQRYRDDLSLAEIAQAQSIQLPLAKYRVRQGLKLLKELLLAAGIER